MSFTPYLQTTDYGPYGIPDANLSQVKSACMTVNNYLSRREGLLWSPDANGVPAYMTNLTPSRTLELPNQIAPGSSVVVTLPEP